MALTLEKLRLVDEYEAANTKSVLLLEMACGATIEEAARIAGVHIDTAREMVGEERRS